MANSSVHVATKPPRLSSVTDNFTVKRSITSRIGRRLPFRVPPNPKSFPLNIKEMIIRSSKASSSSTKKPSEIVNVKATSLRKDEHFLLTKISSKKAKALEEDSVAFRPVGRPGILESVLSKIEALEHELKTVKQINKKELEAVKQTNIDFAEFSLPFRMINMVESLYNLEEELIIKYLPEHNIVIVFIVRLAIAARFFFNTFKRVRNELF